MTQYNDNRHGEYRYPGYMCVFIPAILAMAGWFGIFLIGKKFFEHIFYETAKKASTITCAK